MIQSADVERRRDNRSMKNVVWAGCAAGLMLVVTGCSPIYYAPSVHNVPMLQGKGDGTFAVHVASDGGAVQGAYAVAEHVGVMVNVNSFKQKDNNDNDGGSGSLFEVGVGYHRNLGGTVVWENYLLLGGGSVEDHFSLSTGPFKTGAGTLDAKFTRWGVQPSLSLHSRIVDTAVSLRLMGLKYSDASGNLIYNGQDQVAYLNGLGSQFLVEPAITLKGGWDPIKLQLQLGWSKNITSQDFNSFHMRGGFASLGLVYDLRRDHSSGGIKTK